MTPRSLRIAYAIPSLVAIVLAFLVMIQLDQRGVLGPRILLTVSETGDSRSNERIVSALDRVARDTGATLIRVVADRSSPTTRRTLLTTTEPGSVGAAWATHGYRDFDPSIRTSVEPVSQLVRFDPTGDYEVVGTRRDAERFTIAFRHVGYEVAAHAVPSLPRLALETGAQSAMGLIGIAGLASSALCVAGTLGNPRRTAVRSLWGGSWRRHALAESKAGRAGLTASVCFAAAAMGALMPFNGLIQSSEFATVALLFWGTSLVPTLVAHTICCVIAARLPVPSGLRGARPFRAVVWLASGARVPAALLLVSICFAAVSSSAVVRAGDADRELRAAGAAVRLSVTSDPRPGDDTNEYWERIGTMARDGLRDGSAFLAAPRDIALTETSEPLTALFVDDGYLRRQRTYAADGHRIRGSDTEVQIWIPDELTGRRDEIVTTLDQWELRLAKAAGIQSIEVGTLRRGQFSYSYPDSPSVSAWLDRSVIVSAPAGSAVFTDHLLGAWLSTGDVVFRDEAAALRTVTSHNLDREFSAVVSVGQEAAEQVRAATVSARVDAGSATAAFAVATLTAVLAAVVHRRRNGGVLFVRSTAGWSFIRSNRGLLTFEAVLLSASVLVAVNTMTGASTTAGRWNAALDPAALSAPVGALVACSAALLVAAMSIAVLAVTGRRAVRDHGRET